jgi:hypothetical protein
MTIENMVIIGKCHHLESLSVHCSDCKERKATTAKDQPDDWRTTLAAILYPDGIKHSQQSEWEWMMKRVIELKATEREISRPDLIERIRNIIRGESGGHSLSNGAGDYLWYTTKPINITQMAIALLEHSENGRRGPDA